jgi:hypothetical protein
MIYLSHLARPKQIFYTMAANLELCNLQRFWIRHNFSL